MQSAVPLINDLNLPFNKICTWSVNHFEMIKDLAQNGKPLIIDTGTIDFDELKELDDFYKESGGGQIIIFYDFHTENSKEFNFAAISKLKSKGYIVGYTPQGRKRLVGFFVCGCGCYNFGEEADVIA